jgi:hypothetical protein
MRISEPKPHEINKLLVSFDFEVRKTGGPQSELRNRDVSDIAINFLFRKRAECLR